MTVGIDLGGTTTKIAGFGKDGLFGFRTVQANDPLGSADGTLYAFLDSNSLPLSAVNLIAVTGARAEACGPRLLDIPCRKVEEFQAIGRGGLYLAGLPQAIVVSMGTGTAVVRATPIECRHLGGTGVGGGTLLGLSKCILNTTDFDEIVELAAGGNLAKVDLLVGDLSPPAIASLSGRATASNFGRLSPGASKADYALGILNLVFQTIGLVALFAAAPFQELDVVLTGKLTAVPQARDIFAGFAVISPLRFHFPPQAEYGTAVGAALSV
jgi:type II pantothenate kinase